MGLQLGLGLFGGFEVNAMQWQIEVTLVIFLAHGRDVKVVALGLYLFELRLQSLEYLHE